ncbi:hypothetical protein FACS189419_04490 [Planctomycetales bacterium]|nr:hypothetical protein FACS189419_04490 [Planctomycetales bacterium]
MAAGVWNTTGAGDDTVITINGSATSTSGKKGTSVGTPVIDFSGLTLTGNLTGLRILETGNLADDNWSNVNFTIGGITLKSSSNFEITGLDIGIDAAKSWTIGAIDIESNSNATGIRADSNFDFNLTITNVVNVYSVQGIARGVHFVDLNATGKIVSINAPVVAVTDFGDAVAINAPNSTVVLGANAAAVTSGDSNGIGVQAGNLTLRDGFNNLGNKFTALITQPTGVVNLGAINLTGLTNSKITASQFVLTGNANIGDVVIDGDGYAVSVDLQGHNFTAASDFIGTSANNLTIIKDTSGGSGIAELMKLTGNINITDKATVKIDGSNFTNSDTITLYGPDAVLVVGGGGAGTKEFDGNVAATATAKLAALNGADITDSGIQVKSASGTYEWGAVKDANSINDWYIAVIGINSLSTNSNATEVAHLFHNKYTVWHAVQDHLISGTSRSGSGYLGQSPCGKVTSYAPCGSILGTAARTAWVNYVGRSNSYFDTAFQSNWKIGTDGMQVGSDLYRTKKTQFGVLFGYEGGKATVPMPD